MNKGLSPLQQNLLEMMKWLDSYCREHSLRYYALGGTMLGAMRHQGFIPWDDDIDIALPRKDYNKLIEGFKNEGRYWLESVYSEADDYCYAYSKLYDTHTTMVEHKRINLVRGTFIDIFPFDGLGQTEEEAFANFKPIKRWYNFYLCFVAGIRKGRALSKNLAVVIARLVPKFMFSNYSIRLKLDKMCSHLDYDDCKWGGNPLGAWGFKEVMPLSINGTPTEYQFEDMKINGPEKGDEYLTHLYGDWRKLPPKEKQVTHHDFVMLDLEKGYLESDGK